MCMDHSMKCKCGKREASFNLKNEIMPPEIVEALYCPDCSSTVVLDEKTMLADNGWIIHYDMEAAAFYSSKMLSADAEKLSPETLFDAGYATWRGVYPGDHIDSAKDKANLAKMAKADPAQYFQEMKTWAIDRMNRLKDEGWRKAYG